jgi:hypothetical protein
MQTLSQRSSPIRAVDGVTHVVLCWLNQPGDAAARQRIIDASHSFAKIPGVAAVLTGTPLPSTRPVVDSSYDVAVVMAFDSEDALREYEQHPLHKRAVAEVLRPLSKRMLVYDFRNLPPAATTQRARTATTTTPATSPQKK